MNRIVVITGAGAGIGRAAATEFARHGFDVALLARDPARLDHAAAELRRFGVRALPLPTDVADADAVDEAASRIEAELGPIDVWVNAAMATVFGPVSALSADEFRRVTEVTYLGQVHGAMAALRHMRPRRRGTILCVGSALAYRAIPLQSAYCGAKFALRGFLDSLRAELIHDGLPIAVTTIDLPAVNTPQFEWSRNHMGVRPKPVAPIFQPEVAARALYFAALNPRREVWVGLASLKAAIAGRIAPGLVDRYLARAAYKGQLTRTPLDPSAPDNLFHPVPGPYGARGRFTPQARPRSWQLFTDRHRSAGWGLAALGALGAAMLAVRRRRG